MIGVNRKFPDFALTGVDGNNEIVDVCLSEFEGWTVVYFYPKDFTFVCPTEIAAMDKLLDDGLNVVGISGDNEYCKLNWKESNALISDIRHPLCADAGLFLAGRLGIIDDWEGVALRATYIIDPDLIIRHVSVNGLDTGRSAKEIARTAAALQAGGLTGCSWTPGDSLLG